MDVGGKEQVYGFNALPFGWLPIVLQFFVVWVMKNTFELQRSSSWVINFFSQGVRNSSFTRQKKLRLFYHQCQIKEMIGEADKDDSGSVDFGERNVFHLALLLVCQRNNFNTLAIISIEARPFSRVEVFWWRWDERNPFPIFFNVKIFPSSNFNVSFRYLYWWLIIPINRSVFH